MRGHLALAIIALSSPLLSQEVVKKVGQATFAADLTAAHPGGVLVVRLESRFFLGTSYAVLAGRHVIFEPFGAAQRALLPVALTDPPGPTTVGIEILTRRGRERIPLDVTIAPHFYGYRRVFVPEEKRLLLKDPRAIRDGRRLLLAVRTETDPHAGPLRAPVSLRPRLVFGAHMTYIGASPVEYLMDGSFGEQHPGVDYEVPVGTPVQAPGRGTVVLAEPLTLTGHSLVIDHGSGIVSSILHLSRIDVREGETVEAGKVVGLSGASGLAASPHLHWGVYLHGIAVDPAILAPLLE